MAFKIEDKKVILSKDCNMCTHIKVCKFHSKMKSLCTSNEFYSMNEYLEWNNSLKAFELNSSCMYYNLSFNINDDKSLHLGISKPIIEKIISLEKPKDVSSWLERIDKNEVEFRFTDKEPLIIKVTDLLDKYKFA